MFLLLFVVLCAVCFVLFVHFSECVLFCFSCSQLCRMFLYRLITSITNKPKHNTKNMYVFVVCCCVCCLFLCCLISVSVCVLCCFFLFPTMPHVPLYVNNEHNKHNKTRNNKRYALLFVVVGCAVCVCVWFGLLFLVSDYAACSFIG